jgi:uncharacterized protein with HEPN domain
MAPPEFAARLFDIIEAIGIARDEIAGLTLDAFEADRRSRLLVERAIEIVSEASRHLPAEMKARHHHIPWRKVAGIGNVIRHDYQRVAADVLWNVVNDQLPSIESACREELANAPGEGSLKS